MSTKWSIGDKMYLVDEEVREQLEQLEEYHKQYHLFPIEALVALVERGTVIIRGELAKYGEFQFDPREPAMQELDRRFKQALAERRPK